MMEDLLWGFGVMAVILAVIIGVGYWAQSYQCEGYAKITGKPTKYVGLQCYVKEADGWYRIEGVVSK